MITDRAVQPQKAPKAEGQRSLPPSAARAQTNNLPLPLSSLIGRIEAAAEVRQLLLAHRLVTLTGPGGVGKTRLAVEVAAGLLDRYADGAWWVELAPLSDASLVANTVALALGIRHDPTRPGVAALQEYLADKHLLLVLDNCEHLVGEIGDLAGQLLHRIPALSILATSREPLGLGGEQVWSVPPLTVPCLQGKPAAQNVAESEAGQLFLERARAIRPDFVLTAAAASAIAQICCRVDGIPLAVELAAARVRVLSVPQIAAHLQDLFRLLTAGSRIAVGRHQTIEATIQWSYDLLTPREQVVFERLSVFASAFNLEAAQAVASDPDARGRVLPVDVLDLISQLVAKSLLIVRHDAEARYSMLDTIRQYAWQRLAESEDQESTRQRHLAYYLDLAEHAQTRLTGTDQEEWLSLLGAELDNLRAALIWSQESGAGETGLRLASALASFWIRVGQVSEGNRWLEHALAGCRGVGPVRVEALYQAGRLAELRGDYGRALALARQSLILSRRLGNKQSMARALGLMGWTGHARGAREAARVLLEEGLALARESGDERTIARTLLYLGDLRLRQGALDEAASLFQEGRSLYEKQADRWCLAWALGGLGEVARRKGDYPRAEAHLQLSLVLYHDLSSTPEIPYPLEALALAAADQGQFEKAARLWGAASTIRDSAHVLLPPSYETDYGPTLANLRATLGEEAFAAAWIQGQAMSLTQALALATEPLSPSEPDLQSPASAGTEATRNPHPVPEEHVLTPREAEVLRLVASGLTDAQIGEDLVISPRTVGKHVQSIYSKLYLSTRSAATRWAIEHGLG